MKAFTTIGKDLYKSPEMYLEIEYTKKTDIWSAGILFYYIFEGKFPFNEHSLYKLAKLVVESQPPAITKNINPQI